MSASDFVQVLQVEEQQPTGPPVAQYVGVLDIGEGLPCYVLSDGQRVLSRTGATGLLAGKKGGGQLEKYIATNALKRYMPADLQMIDFELPEVVNKTVKGISSDTFLEICRGYVRALADKALDTPAQTEMAHKASLVLAACANVGLAALIDEATGYQYVRAEDALRVKLKAFIAEEMRQWEPTFPNELWLEFARLTKWKGSVTKRPKYWGKLVNELVYEYLDPDVAKWLKENAPKPRKGRNYHQWLTDQFGLKKLVEHIWMLIGMARACKTMEELRDKKADASGRHKIRVTVYVKPPNPQQRTFLDVLGDDPGDAPDGEGEK